MWVTRLAINYSARGIFESLKSKIVPLTITENQAVSIIFASILYRKIVKISNSVKEILWSVISIKSFNWLWLV